MWTNNKRLGTAYEHKVCEALRMDGYWVHFLTPDNRGAQPFDIIAVKNGRAIAIDCKTSTGHIFRISRLEDNQKNAFELWRARGNGEGLILVEYERATYVIPYNLISEKGSIDLNNHEPLWRD